MDLFAGELFAGSDDPPAHPFRFAGRLTAMQHTVDSLNRVVQDQVNCPRDILRPISTESGLIQEIRTGVSTV